MPSFVLGTVNQGALRPGEVFSAYKRNTIFLSGECSAPDYLDAPRRQHDLLHFLKSLGSIAFELGDISPLHGEVRIAELHPVNGSGNVWSELVTRVFGNGLPGYAPQNPGLMTLSPSTALRSGDSINVGFLSVMQPLWDGAYRLHHDYPLTHASGPRFEKFESERIHG